ncbi:MAG: TolC family outer membrane protein [Rhodoferax sp.]|uniref:TolC family outer membrane protein n=1 Tax=Rhodoferax sp. TaxID=50421 RepID=UPI002736AA29|nr:TolC family outer membrane protein [Rhodoferax sp.]MDP3864991.1 TolC family outer membrane protein [Rhodoferax sp.]
MTLNTKLTGLMLALLTSWGAHAQALPPALVNAARQAVLTNPDVQARWNGFKAASNAQDVARAGFLPQLDVKASVGKESRTSPSTDYGRYNIKGTELTLNQMLFDGMFTSNEVKRLGYAKLTSYYELAEISETTAMEAVRAYVDVVRYRELVDAATQNFVEHKQSAQQVEQRASAGVGRGADVEQANGRLALAESSLLTELTSLHDASARYLRVVGEKPPANLPSLPEPFTLGKMPASTDALLQEGLPGSPTLNAALENARTYKQAVATRQAAFMPRIDFNAYQQRDKNLSGVTGNTDLSGMKLVLNDNLYRGNADVARKRQAQDQQAQARELQEKACRDVRQSLTIAYSDMRRLDEQQRYMDLHRLATEKSREAYRQQFDIGQRTLLDVLDSQSEYFEASRSYINARHNQAGAQARTLAGMGQLVTALGVTRSDVPAAEAAGQERGRTEMAELCPFEVTEVDTVDAIKARFATPVAVKAPGSYVVLIPSPDGSIGRVTVQGKQGEQVLSQSGQAAPLDGGAGFNVDKQKMQQDFGTAIAALPPIPEQFVLYFVRGGTQLTKESRAIVPKMLARAKERKSLEVWLVGHTDTVGSPKRNEALGLQRAQTIAKQFRKLGLNNSALTVESFGERSPLVATPDETDEPRNRRGEVTLR